MPEKFAVYGFQLEIPDDWRVEFNPKSNRREGDVALHSPKNNICYFSWGKLEEAKKRYGSLEDHRNDTIKRIRKSSNVQSAELITSDKLAVSGHEGLRSEVEVRQNRGIMGRGQVAHRISSVHFYCPESSRFHVIHWDITVGDEYADPQKILASMASSVECHSGSDGPK